MLGRKQELTLQFQEIADGVLLVVAFWLAYMLRILGHDWLDASPIPPFNDFRWLLFVIMPFGPLILEMQGFYAHPLQKTFAKSVSQLLRGAIWLAVILGLCVIFLRLQVPSRSVLLIFGALASALLLAREKLTVWHVRNRAKSGKFRESVVLAGLPLDMRQLRASLTEDQRNELDIVAEIDIEHEPVSVLVEALHTHSVSRVIFAGAHAHMNRLQAAIEACEVEGVEAWLMADFVKTVIARPAFDMLGTQPMLVFRTTPEVSWALFVKAVIDRVCAAVALALLFFPLIAVAVTIKLTSPGPIFFRQLRGGKHGKPFTMFKFRSMHTDAEMRRAELEAFNQMSGPVFKVENDPRVTKIGHWLRKTSIDELPQLLNVLQGSMSLVGPRPLPLYEVEKFENTAQRRRLSVKPGLTCLWQVSGRNEVRDFNEWVKLDLKYIDNWSIWLDLSILLRTVPVVVFGFGAK